MCAQKAVSVNATKAAGAPPGLVLDPLLLEEALLAAPDFVKIAAWMTGPDGLDATLATLRRQVDDLSFRRASSIASEAEFYLRLVTAEAQHE
jgi:hypothetical protein